MGLTYSSVIDADRDEVFSWHTRPGAITRLIPPWQPVRVLREAGSLRDGRATLTLPGGLRWVAAHQPDGYDPPNAFADELTSLPLPWRHTHQFSPSGEGATLVTDVIETPLPARMLRSTVVYRHRQLAADLAALARARDISQDTLTVAVTGSSGLIGTALAWIALDDLLDIYRRAVLDEALSGPVNAVAPEPVRNADYTRTLAAVLRRPAVLPVPGFGPRLLLGDEGAREIAQASQYVLPERLTGAGHRFRQPELTGALRHLFGRDGT